MRHLFPKLTLLLVFLTFAGAFFNISTAQQLPNAGFEQWNGSWNGKPQPDGWNLSNVEQVGLQFNVGERTSDAHSGSYAVKCQGTEVGAMGITAVSPSWVTLGTSWAYLDGLDVGSATAGTTGGISWGYRPDTLAVWIKRTSAGNEDMNLVYYSWRGTAYNDRYKNKDNGCTETGRTDEESDICKSDINECKTPSGDAVQVAEGWLRTKTQYPAWTRIKLPIKYFNNDIPTKMNVILSASRYPEKRANSGQYTSSVLIVDDISMIYASDIHEIYFDGKKYSNFNKDKREIYYEVPVGKSLPEIVCKRSGRKLSGSEISIVNGVKDGTPAVITVRAEDGSSTTEYKVYFVSVRDINPYPSTIKVNGTAISGFNAYASDYTVTLPYGTTETPVIDVVKANNKQTVKIEPYSVPGTAKITVFAENDEYTAVYNIKFEIGKLNDTTLKDIQVNGVSIEGFSPTKTIYTVDIPEGTTDAPEITPVSAYEPGAQTIVIDRKGIKEPSTVTVSAPGAISSRVYKISYNVIKSKYSYLKDLKVGGVTVANFAPATLSYTYPLPIGTTEVPAVTYTPGDDFQTITKEDGGLDGITKVTVKAQNGINTSIYRISFPLSKSSNSKLSDLKVAGKTIEGFSSDVISYSYLLAEGTKERPAVTWTPGDGYQTIKEINGGTNGITKVIVTAEDESVTVYSISFSVSKSSNSKLKDIKIGGVSLDGFTSDKLSYQYVLPTGTTTLPKITWTKGDSYQTVTPVYGGVEEVTKLIVTAQDGSSSEYSIAFSVAKSSNSKLKDIQLDGVSLVGFNQDKTSYTYSLPIGTTKLPVITWTVGDQGQSVEVKYGDLEGDTKLYVTATDGSKTTYTITFKVSVSSNSKLKDIQVNGESLVGFSSDKTIYEYVFPIGTTADPEITWTAGDAFQTINLYYGGLEGDTKIVVTAQDLSYTEYVITFSVQKSSYSKLQDLMIDGVTIDGFAPDVTSYSYMLPIGTTQLPEITWTLGNKYQTVDKQEGGVNDDTKIVVMAQDGSYTEYIISFSVKPATNSTLKDILLDGVSLEGFQPEVTSYTVTLDRGTKSIPAISYIPNDESQIITKQEGVVNDKSYITVRSLSGGSTVYSLNFPVTVSANSNLSDLKIDGETIEGFESDKFDYSYKLSSGMVQLPEITYTQADEYQNVFVSKGTVNGTTAIYVTAENGVESVYHIDFEVEKSTDSNLKNILLDGVALEGFDADTKSYTVVLDENADAPVITVEKALQQTVNIDSPLKYGVASISVVAEDGGQSIYTINFIDSKSSNCSLADIQVAGVTVEGFNPDVTSYNITLAQGTTALPAISYTKGDETQRVEMAEGGIDGTTTISVMSENGSVKVYSLNFSTEKSSDGLLSDILVDGVSIEGFASDVFDYTYKMQKSVTERPSVVAVKSNASSRVDAVMPYLDGDVKFYVKSEDGTSESLYTVHLVYAIDDDTNLSEIKVNGEALTLVEGQYTYNLEGSFENVPVVTYTKAAKTQRVVLNNNITRATLDVTAESGYFVTYTINYNKVYSSNALLSDIQYFDDNLQQFVSIEGFASDKYDYEITLPLDASDIYTLNCVGDDKSQTYQISYASLNEVTKIKVTAEDGVTTADYSVKFIASKSNVCTLDDITIGGEQVPEFSSEITEYEITLPVGDTQRGLLRYVKSDAKSLVVVKDDVYNATSEIVVIAEDGTEKSYKLSFKQGFTGKSNVLKSIIVNGAAITDFDPQVFVYNVETYSGIVPNVYCEKEYEEQSLHIATSEQGKTVITVKSNQEGVADAVYTLNHNVKQPYNVLTSIKIDGKIIDGFNPYKTKYVVLVTKTPETVIAEGAESEKTINTASHVRFETAQSDVFASVKYDIFFHYTTDEVDGTFEQSVKTKYNNKNKPQGWNCPADFVSGHLGTYTSGEEVNITTDYHSQGSNAVQLKTVYLLPSAESMFGCMSLSEMSFDLGSYKVLFHSPSKNSFGEGITYRNSPDKMSMDFYPVANNKISEWHFIYKFKDEAGISYTNTYKGSYATKNTWQTMNLDLNYPAEFGSPSSLDIIVNSAATETLSDMYVGTSGFSDENRYTSTLIVDNLKFFYNSEISAIKVNGVAATMDKTAASVTIDSECSGNPVIDITGKVEDQMYNIDYGTEVNGVRVVNIRSYAEDMSYTDYTLTVTRPLSTQNELKDIKVEVVSLSDFDASKLDYEYSLSAGKHIVPNVTVNGKSSHQNLSMSMSGSVLSIISTSESGESKTYTVTFIEEELSNADLTSLSVAGKEISFDPAQTEYAVELAPRTTKLPEILYTKISDKQSVTLTEGGVEGVTTIAVKSADATTEKEYKIAFTVADNKSTTSKLSAMAVLDAVNPIEFDPDTKEYTYNIIDEESPVLNYTRAFREDSMLVILNRDSVMWSLHNVLSETENEYKLNYNVVKSSNSHLADIKLAGESVEEFNPNITDYTWSVERNVVPSIDAVMAEAGQAVETIYDEAAGTYTITVTAPDGVATTTYNVAVSVKKGTEAKASSIALDGVEIAGFDPEVTDYTVDLPAGSVKVPEIVTYDGSAGASSELTVNDIDNITELVVTSEDGNVIQNYYLSFNVLKSADATLSSISSDFEVLDDFAPDKFEYTIVVPVGAKVPVITYKKSWEGQTVTMEQSMNVYEIEVVSESGDVKNVYVVNIDKQMASGSELKGITLDGNSLEGYEPTRHEYSVELPRGTRVLPVLNTLCGYYGQSVTINSNGVEGTTEINVVSEDQQSTTEYVINFSVEKSDNSLLRSILLDDVEIKDFEGTEFNYVVDYLPVGVVKKPVVTWVLDDYAQKVEKYTSGNVVSLQVEAEDGTKSEYSIEFMYNISSVDTLKMIYVNGVPLSDFESQKTEYSYMLPPETTDMSAVSFDKGDDFQTVSVTPGGVNGVTEIIVTAQNSVVTKRYQIQFSVEKSHNSHLDMILLDGEDMDIFNADQLQYEISLERGRTSVPEVTYRKGQKSQIIDKSVDDTSVKLKVTAEDGMNVSEYKVDFIINLSPIDTLKMITLDDVDIEEFKADKSEYTVELPKSSISLPVIKAVKGDEWQKVSVKTGGVTDDAVIDVEAQDGIHKRQYIIHFSIAKSDYSYLEMIKLDGDIIDGFQSDKFDYKVDLDFGKTELPEVTWSLGEQDQKVDSVWVEDTVKLKVTAEKGNFSEYVIDFEKHLSKADTLDLISVKYNDTERIKDFKPSVFTYNDTLPVGADLNDVDVDYREADKWQVVEVVKFDGGYKLNVTAQDAAYKRTYTVAIVVAKSTNTELKDLMSGGVTVPDFDADVLDYFIELPVHTKTIPDVTYEKGDGYQVIEQSESEDRKIQKVKVTAQNGDSRTYTVTYTIKLSDNANLNSIKLDDVLIPGFDPETYKYEFELPYNTKKVPVISYEMAEPEQIVVEDYTEDLNGTSYIKVTAEDGVTVNTYSIAFSVAKSDVTTLDMIYYDGKAIEDFDKEDNDYDVDLPYGTVKAPEVTYDLTQPVETAVLSMTEVENVGWDAVIEVTAEDGISRNDYTVHFIVALDSENRLSDIKVFGNTIAGFDKDVEYYDIVLPVYSDSTLLPKKEDVEYTKMSRNETVVVSQPTVESIVINVTAQDGSSRNYVIKTTIALSSNASLSSLMISDKVLPGFAPDVLDYEYRIEFGATYVDTAKYVISYILQEPQGQSVTIQHKMDKHGEEDPFTYIVTVVAQDKTEKQYTIHFVPDTFDPTTEPTVTDVCITSTADGGWKFVTKCKNITVILNDLSGKIIATASLPTVDLNIGEICDPNAEGFTYYAPQDQVVSYRFMYAQKKRVTSGKFKGQRR